MTDEKWGTYGAYQEAARTILAALKMARMHVALSRMVDHLAVVDAAIAQAEKAGIET